MEEKPLGIGVQFQEVISQIAVDSFNLRKLLDADGRPSSCWTFLLSHGPLQGRSSRIGLRRQGRAVATCNYYSIYTTSFNWLLSWDVSSHFVRSPRSVAVQSLKQVCLS